MPIIFGKTLHKLGRIAATQIRRAKAETFGTNITDTDLLRAWSGPQGSVEEVVPAFRDRKGLAFVPPSPVEVAALYHQIYSNRIIEKTCLADCFCHHQFDLLGSGFVDVTLDPLHGDVVRQKMSRILNIEVPDTYRPIDWHRDFKSRTRWDVQQYHSSIRICAGADIKVPWELSRCYHFATLGEAYVLTGDERYAWEIIFQITDWIIQNPYEFGVNWFNAMEAAIRVVNWCVAYSFLRKLSFLSDAFLKIFLKSLLAHGRYIFQNLERNYERHGNNHYLADLVGLIYLGVLFPEFKEAEKWRQVGSEEIVKQMEEQVYLDGCHFEASSCYHCLVLEFFFSAAYLCKMNGYLLPDSFWKHLEKMFEATLYLLKPRGGMPQIGDNDSGRLHVFAWRDVFDRSYLMSIGAILFERADFKINFCISNKKGTDFDEEALWLFGPEGHTIWSRLPYRENSIGAKSFCDAGWYVIRNFNDYCLVSCGPNGQWGGHAHNDKLSLEISLQGKDVVIDVGSYIYTLDPIERNRFRSTAVHNTLVIDREEQAPLDSSQRGLFRLPDVAQARCLKWDVRPDEICLVAEHEGWRRLGWIHRRTVHYRPAICCFEILDELIPSATVMKKPAWKLHWHLAPEVDLQMNAEVGKSDVYFVFCGGKASIEPAFYSPAYGKKVPIKRIVVRPLDPKVSSLTTLISAKPVFSPTLGIRFSSF